MNIYLAHSIMSKINVHRAANVLVHVVSHSENTPVKVTKTKQKNKSIQSVVSVYWSIVCAGSLPCCNAGRLESVSEEADTSIVVSGCQPGRRQSAVIIPNNTGPSMLLGRNLYLRILVRLLTKLWCLFTRLGVFDRVVIWD